VADTHSISAGLDYPGIGPEHAFLYDAGRVKFASATDDDALRAFTALSRLEGIIPALEPSHGMAFVMKQAAKMSPDQIIIANLCGRGDKDIFTVAKAMGMNI
jgi:tryptophan synthase beta chain